jgi:hypothetical protein
VDVKSWVLIAALTFAGPAFAIPPMGPIDADLAVAKAYIRATEQSDFPAYRSLFAPDARIIQTETPASGNKEQWFAAAAAEFSRERQSHFLNVFARAAITAGKRTTRVAFIVELSGCGRTFMMECFPEWRSEVITVEDAKIIQLETSGDFSFRLTADGKWTTSP